nr:metalloregulator ArsR/SmtB family transcription factor [Henriciella aquimarina]
MSPRSEDMIPLADEATSLLKALAHPARLMICCTLRDRELSVGEIEDHLGIHQPRLSRELAKLREEGLVETRREAKQIYYRLSDASRAGVMIDALCAVMLDKPLPIQAPEDAPTLPLKPSSTDGSGHFARIVP